MPLYFPQMRIGRGITRGITTEELDAVKGLIADARAAVERARPGRADAALLVREMQWTLDVMALMNDDAHARLEGDDGKLGSVPEPQRQAFADRLDGLIDRHRSLWLARNRPGGLRESRAWLEHLLGCYETGMTDRGWSGPQ